MSHIMSHLIKTLFYFVAWEESVGILKDTYHPEVHFVQCLPPNVHLQLCLTTYLTVCNFFQPDVCSLLHPLYFPSFIPPPNTPHLSVFHPFSQHLPLWSKHLLKFMHVQHSSFAVPTCPAPSLFIHPSVHSFVPLLWQTPLKQYHAQT